MYTPSLDEEDSVFIDNYGKKIIEARERMDLTREEFAKKINEKESMIKRIEHEDMRPNQALTKKIERFLNIRLTETYERKKITSKPAKGKLTLGDIIELE